MYIQYTTRQRSIASMGTVHQINRKLFGKRTFKKEKLLVFLTLTREQFKSKLLIEFRHVSDDSNFLDSNLCVTAYRLQSVERFIGKIKFKFSQMALESKF